MTLRDTCKAMRSLLESIASDMDKAEAGNKAAAQRVRIHSIRFEKVAKVFRKESVKAAKSSTGKKKPAKASKAKGKAKATKTKAAAPKKPAAKKKAAPKRKVSAKRASPAKKRKVVKAKSLARKR